MNTSHAAISSRNVSTTEPRPSSPPHPARTMSDNNNTNVNSNSALEFSTTSDPRELHSSMPFRRPPKWFIWCTPSRRPPFFIPYETELACHRRAKATLAVVCKRITRFVSEDTVQTIPVSAACLSVACYYYDVFFAREPLGPYCADEIALACLLLAFKLTSSAISPRHIIAAYIDWKFSTPLANALTVPVAEAFSKDVIMTQPSLNMTFDILSLNDVAISARSKASYLSTAPFSHLPVTAFASYAPFLDSTAILKLARQNEEGIRKAQQKASQLGVNAKAAPALDRVTRGRLAYGYSDVSMLSSDFDSSPATEQFHALVDMVSHVELLLARTKHANVPHQCAFQYLTRRMLKAEAAIVDAAEFSFNAPVLPESVEAVITRLLGPEALNSDYTKQVDKYERALMERTRVLEGESMQRGFQTDPPGLTPSAVSTMHAVKARLKAEKELESLYPKHPFSGFYPDIDLTIGLCCTFTTLQLEMTSEQVAAVCIQSASEYTGLSHALEFQTNDDAETGGTLAWYTQMFGITEKDMESYCTLIGNARIAVLQERTIPWRWPVTPRPYVSQIHAKAFRGLPSQSLQPELRSETVAASSSTSTSSSGSGSGRHGSA